MRSFQVTAVLLIQLCLAFASDRKCTPSATTASGPFAPTTICSGDLIFEDNFDFLDMQRWQHENTLSGGGNWEFQWYLNNRSNSFTKDGALHIRPTLLVDTNSDGYLYSGLLDINNGAPADQCTNAAYYGCLRVGNSENILNPIKSARLRTVNSFRFRYGKLEISAKMPAGDWIWPALWLMPAQNAYGTWPSSGEIDLTETRGNRKLSINGVNIGVEQTGSTLHYGPYPELNGWPRAHFTRNDPSGYHTSFRKYQMEWTPDYLKFSVDGVELGTITPPAEGFWKYGDFGNAAPNVENPWRFGSKMAPFDQEFYIIMNVAIGGTNYFPDGAQNPDPKPWNNNSPTAMRDFWRARDAWLATWGLNQNEGADASLQVDYVRVWAL